MPSENPTVMDEIRAATATVLVRISYYIHTLAMNLDLPAVMVEMERLHTRDMKKAMKQEAQQAVDSLRNGDTLMGRN